MTINFEKFIAEVDREIQEKLSTKAADNWKDDYDTDCLYQQYCDEILDYEGGLTEDDDAFGKYTNLQHYRLLQILKSSN